jgi:hypothetical protein
MRQRDTSVGDGGGAWAGWIEAMAEALEEEGSGRREGRPMPSVDGWLEGAARDGSAARDGRPGEEPGADARGGDGDGLTALARDTYGCVSEAEVAEDVREGRGAE